MAARQHRRTLDHHEVQANPQRWVRARDAHSVCGRGGGDHQARRLQDAFAMGALDALVHRLAQAEIVGGECNGLQCYGAERLGDGQHHGTLDHDRAGRNDQAPDQGVSGIGATRMSGRHRLLVRENHTDADKIRRHRRSTPRLDRPGSVRTFAEHPDQKEQLHDDRPELAPWPASRSST